MKKTKYWAFEGNEGVGKTKLSKAFAEKFDAFWTYEPNGETEDLRRLRDLALDNTKQMDKYAREYLLMANRAIHHHTCVKPLLDNMNMVISDRSILSGLVYAKIETYTFDKWMEVLQLANILNFPEVIVFCKNKRRKLKEDNNDIYDNASFETLDKIDSIYEEAIDYLKNRKNTKHIKILEFEISFNYTVDKNVDRLYKLIKKESEKEED
jgi:thymidylate kinase